LNTKEYISSGIIESYILGLASTEEAGILECVMKNNAEVKAAFEEAQKTMEALANAQAVAPPADLKSKIWEKLQKERTIEDRPPVFSVDIPAAKPQEEIRIQRTGNWKAYAVAAMALFLISVAGNLFWMNDRAKTQQQLTAIQSEKQSQDLAIQKMNQKMDLFTNPEMKVVMLKGVEKHTDSKATVFWDKKTKSLSECGKPS